MDLFGYIKKYGKYSFKEKVFGIHYKLFERSELDILYKDCIKFVLDNIKKNI